MKGGHIENVLKTEKIIRIPDLQMSSVLVGDKTKRLADNFPFIGIKILQKQNSRHLDEIIWINLSSPKNFS